MSHPEPDDLALIALGESLGEPVDAHVAHCEICQREIDLFQQTIGLAELSNYGEDAPPVGEHVWQAITAELGIGDTVSINGTGGDTVTAQRFVPNQPVPGDSRVGRDAYDAAATDLPADNPGRLNGQQRTGQPGDRGPVTVQPDEFPTAARTLRVVPGSTPPPDDKRNSPPAAGTATATPTGTRTPVGGTGRRRSRWIAPLAAAVVGIALGAGVVAVLNRSAPDTVEAVAPLTPVPTGPLAAKDGQQLGQADLVASPTGPQVRISAADLPAANSSAYEVWLFGNDGRMVSLGTLADGNGSFTVPPGISTEEYRVVDISDEPPDGNPAHSGVSLIRGQFS